ncbi:hypothetical protein ORIO_21170 (plasmid) [Cereibacter azotoformans]|uniref:hypothetical protein n=1 Tax=Cereibacter azotoformans TaxID=43057 RepID=UPI001EEB2B2D|nr:hypothetical protein [Cereibacter azotoformans]ULB12305.1 hypothetical protein ORIO_21170 [Cereibacter azotoformans]
MTRDEQFLADDKMRAEIARMIAEAGKLNEEAGKIRRETILYPLVIATGLVGSIAALTTVLLKIVAG